MSRRHYSSSAAATALTSSVSSSDTTLVVGSITGLPVQYPYTLILDPDSVSEEVVDVTAGSSTTLTVTRGVDGTTALPHTAGAVVQHGVSARDFDEPNAHVNASTGVHSVSGSVVGTSDAQTLTNKMLTSPTVTGGTFSAPALTAPTATGSLTGFGGGWTSYTPTFSQVGTLTTSSLDAKYIQIGKTVIGRILATISSSGTSGTAVSFTLPVAAAVTTINTPVGSGSYFDLSTVAWYGQIAQMSGATSTQGVVAAHSAGFVGANPVLAAASGDIFSVSFMYEAA